MNQYAVDAFGPEESLNADNGICKASALADHIICWQVCFVCITHLCHWDAVHGAMKIIYLIHRRLKLGVVVYHIHYITILQYRVVTSKHSPSFQFPQSEPNSVPFGTALLEEGRARGNIDVLCSSIILQPVHHCLRAPAASGVRPVSANGYNVVLQ